jgi:hypothetical protein
MLVNRRIFNVKAGHTQEVANMIKSESGRLKRPARIYISEIGPFDTVSCEFEFATLAEYEKFWKEWTASPEGESFLDKWHQEVERGGNNEIWELFK